MAAKQNVSAGPIGVQSPARVRTVPPGPARNQVPQTGITGSQLADDAVDSEHIAAAAVDREHMNEEASPITRWAPDFDLRLSPAGTTVHYVTDSWAPSADAYTQAVTQIASNYPNTTITFLGVHAASCDALRVSSTGQILITSNSSTLTTIASGFLADNEPHRYEMRRTGTAITAYRDGVLIGAGTAPGAHTAIAQAVSLGRFSGSGTNIVYDCELTDPAAATNNVFMRMDRPGQLCLNACSDPSDPLYSLNTTNLGGSITSTPSSTGRPRYTLVNTFRAGAMPAKRNECDNPDRMAAYSGLGASSTDGYWASIAHVPTATASYDISFDYTGSVLPSAQAFIIGSSFNGPRIHLLTAGQVTGCYGTTTVVAGTTVTQIVDGRTHRVRFTLAQNGANVDGVLYVDGRYVGSGSVAGTIASGDFYIGASATNTQRCPGAITNVRILDVTLPSNSIELLMDEPSGNFANVYPSSGAALSAARRGYVPMRSIPSTDGRGMPRVSQGPLVYSANRSGTAQVMDGSAATEHICTFNSEVEDPTGSLVHTTGIWTAPAPGFVRCSISALLDTAGISDSLAAGFFLNGAAARNILWTQPATDELRQHWIDSMTVAKGDTVDFRVYNIAAGNTTMEQSYSQMRIEFTPTPTAG